MIDHETIDTAKGWCRIGAQKIAKQTYTSAVRYLDQSIAVFQEAGDLEWLTFARHQKLQAVRARGAPEEVGHLLDDVLRGYTVLEDVYGKALALAHHAEWLINQGDRAAALARLNLALAVAEGGGERELLAHLRAQKADLLLEENDCMAALPLFRMAEAALQNMNQDDDAAGTRLSAAEALMRMGVDAEAIALLEDVQAHFYRHGKYREALRALGPLAKLYEKSGMLDDRQRIAELIHLGGQYIINQRQDDDSEPAGRARKNVRPPDSRK